MIDTRRVWPLQGDGASHSGAGLRLECSGWSLRDARDCSADGQVRTKLTQLKSEYGCYRSADAAIDTCNGRYR